MSLFPYTLVFIQLYGNVFCSVTHNFSIFGGKTTKFFDLQCQNTDLNEPVSPLNGEIVSYEKSTTTTTEPDPYLIQENVIHEFIFGHNIEDSSINLVKPESQTGNEPGPPSSGLPNGVPAKEDPLIQYAAGAVGRAELFNNRSAVHLLSAAYVLKGHCRLNITADHMQTALDAFTILINGNLDDLKALPPNYVLDSARTIAMMQLPMEKLAALWEVVKAGRRAIEVPYALLEKYRPLFKYVNAREISRLDLKDPRILKFIGTHPDLDRHQVGVVASKYMLVNPNWREPQYLNMMNNLLCGVPVNFMRRLTSDVFLQLSGQVFYHINACSPLQKRFFLNKMTKTDALGKSYSWSARDVARLGLLLTELYAGNLSSMTPEAMRGITAQVMLQLPATKLQSLSRLQVENLAMKPMNILARKIKMYQESVRVVNYSEQSASPSVVLCMLLLLIKCFDSK